MCTYSYSSWSRSSCIIKSNRWIIIKSRNYSEFGSFNFTPSFKLKYSITELSDFKEYMTNVSSGATNVIYGSETFAAGDLATGILFNTDPFK